MEKDSSELTSDKQMTSSNNEVVKTKLKPPKPEDKPFKAFIIEELIPSLTKGLEAKGVELIDICLENGNRPVTGGSCWMVRGEIQQGRRFWLCFNSDEITSTKVIALSEKGTEPSVLEAFLIDERKIG